MLKAELQKRLLYISLVVLPGCKNSSTRPEQGQFLDLQTLRTAQRIIPAREGYVVVEASTMPTAIESPRQLLLYDRNGSFVDEIRLFGSVQRIGPNRIVINHTFNDWGAETTLGFLAVAYDTLARKSKGGGTAGSFWVDSSRTRLPLRFTPESRGNKLCCSRMK